MKFNKYMGRSFAFVGVLILPLVAVGTVLATSYNVSINKTVSCGSGTKSFSGTANYGGDNSTTLRVTYNPPGSNNTTTEVNTTGQGGTWSFNKNVSVGSTYTIEAYLYDDSSNPDNNDLRDTDTWTFTIQACPSPTSTPTGTPRATSTATSQPSNSPTSTPTTVPSWTPTSTPFATFTPVPTDSPCDGDCNEPTSTPIATETPNGDVCANIDGIQTSVPEGKHLDASGKNCVEFGVPGVPQTTDSSIGGGQVLGTSTMAATGAVSDALFNSIFTLGSLLTSFGIMKNGKKKS